MAGKVYLVGAGPGDRELLTLKAKRLIGEADVIVCDRLVSQDITDMIPSGTEIIDVGKNAGNHPVPQSRINRILVREAEKGKTVVRLKGGDPFVFGRGGEELELLKERSIPFQVVPAVTAGIAAPAYAGIPVTCRDFCSSLHFITGHAKEGSDLNLDFHSLVRLNGTIVFYMGVGAAEKLSDGLLKAGMEPDTPAAVIENGTRPEQRKVITTVEKLGEAVKEEGIKSPAIIVVGRVCSLSEEFDWFSSLPLKGMRIVVTTPEKKASVLGDKLRAQGAQVIVYPCIRTEPIRPISPEFSAYDVLVFTSAEGVRSFFQWLRETGRDSRAVSGLKVACIGEATARAAEKFGIRADFVPGYYDGAHLAEEMIESGFIGERDRLLLLRAEKASSEITDILEKRGVAYTDYPVYRTSLEEHGELGREDFDLVTFTSKSCVEGFVRNRKASDLKGVNALCIGHKTAEEAERYGFNVEIADKPTIDSMVEKLTGSLKERGN